MPNPHWLGNALSCIPFLFGLLFYGWRFALSPSPVFKPVTWGEEGPVIGIVLGATYARVSLFTALDRVEILQDELGRRKIPSVVCLTDTDTIVGYAEGNPACNGTNSYHAGLLLESAGGDKNFTIIRPLLAAREEDLSLITSSFIGTQDLTLVDLTSMLLRALFSRAEKFHGQSISRAILVIPAHYTDAHRTVLHDAASLANITLLRTLTAPTAIAIAHGLDRATDGSEEQRVLVLDVGASTSATLLEIEGGVFETLARVRDRKTGGRALDERVAEYAEAMCIRASGGGKETALDEAQKATLRARAEHTKITLSTKDNALIAVPVNDGTVFSVGLARSEFVAIARNLFEDVVQCVEEALLEANVSASDVDQFILAGGSAYIPRLKELLSQRFPEITPVDSRGVRPDEAAVYGAALHARHFSLEEEHDNFLCCVDITPLAFGIESPKGVFAVVIPRNSVIPNTKTRSFNLTENVVRVFVGQGEYTNGTHFIGSLALPQPVRREMQIHFDYDTARVLTVTAANPCGRSTFTLIYPSDESDAAVARMVAVLEDAAKRDTVNAQIQFASKAKFAAYLAELERHVAPLPADHGDRKTAGMLVNIIREAEAWMDERVYTMEAAVLQEKMMAVEKLVRLGIRTFEMNGLFKDILGLNEEERVSTVAVEEERVEL